MSEIPGTKGYGRFVSCFIESSQSLSFNEACKDFIDFLPPISGLVLDVGAGAGQNSAALAELGYSVVAVEPMTEFLDAARIKYSVLPITWLNGSLPMIECLRSDQSKFDLILVIGVWHHLNEAEGALAMKRFASLLNSGGICAFSLRNGPPGMGTHVYQTDANHTVKQAKKLGLECIFMLEDQPSILKNKDDVKWARLVSQK
ncbi:methyltransferase type 11 [Shewanella sediminis HAW-EB3]|uniref:Methyltransferase type 11 n=2 Tax=Shewanella sediminis TaxID=271097 RepID=A8FY10_SHESH|nr:methyltransferase type 11 [Shewanella sediminis HAW-EB3]